MINKYRLPFLPLSLLLLNAFTITAQSNLIGEIRTTSMEPVAYANVVLYDAEDSTTVYRGAVSDENGKFLLKNIQSNSYLLKVSFVGFQVNKQRIEVGGDTDLGVLVLNEDPASLEEVSINFQNPSVERKVDRLVFKVENTTLSSGSTWNILKKTPGVIVTNNTLQVRNQSVQVYINDRRVRLSASELQTLLENYSGENILSIEVITNPPARYDAEGGSILNIVTSKAISPGYKGSINTSITQAIFPKYTLGTSHYQKGENLNLFVNYSYNPRKEIKSDDNYINFRDNTGVISKWRTDFERITRSNAHNLNLMLDYNFDESNMLIFSANGLLSPGKTFENKVRTEIENRDSENSSFLTESDLNEDQANIGMDLEFKHLLSKPGAEISVKAHYTQYDQSRDQEVGTKYFGSSGDFQNDNLFLTEAEQHINIVTAQVDYNTPVGSSQFEAGLKSAFIYSESGIAYFDGGSGTPVYDPSLSDDFLYDENVFAAYASISKDWEKWSVKGGLRGELTQREGVSLTLNETDSREHLDLFPSLYVMHSLSKNHSLTFDYSRRIQRPRYESLNPFKYFLNEHNFMSGNPDLSAAISNNFNLNYTIRNTYFFDVYYRDNGNTPAIISFQDNENMSIRSVSMNMLESTSYGLDISHGRSLTNWWYAYAYTSFFHESQTFEAVESGNAEVTNEIDGFYGTLYNSLTLSKDGTLTGELSFTYVSDWLSGSYYLEPMTTLSFGLRKSLWNDRAELTLNFEDVLDETNTWLRSRYLNQDNGYFASPESRYVRIGFKYNFGNFSLTDNQRTVKAEERDRI